MVYSRYYTDWNLVAIFALSIFIYFAYMWITNWITASHTYLSIVQLHKTQIYYTTVLLCTGLSFVTDLFITSFNFNFRTTPTEFLRSIVN